MDQRNRPHQAPHPRVNGKLERSHRIDAEEFHALLDGVVIDDAKTFNKKQTPRMDVLCCAVRCRYSAALSGRPASRMDGPQRAGMAADDEPREIGRDVG
jgi:hypothetical protein